MDFRFQVLVISPYLGAYLVEILQMVCLFHPLIQWPVKIVFLTQKTSASSRGVETKIRFLRGS